jgi:hypothetical protein
MTMMTHGTNDDQRGSDVPLDRVRSLLTDADLVAIRDTLIERLNLPFDPVYRPDGTTVGRYEYLHTCLTGRGVSPAIAAWVVVGAYLRGDK